MARCDIISMPTPKACSGKCMKGACGGMARVWVVAACEGMVSLFEKGGNAGSIIKPHGEHTVFPSLEQFQHYIHRAVEIGGVDQLIIIGSGNDVAWVHSCLPECAALLITAEIKYPLLPQWFKEPSPQPHLLQALQTVLVP